MEVTVLYENKKTAVPDRRRQHRRRFTQRPGAAAGCAHHSPPAETDSRRLPADRRRGTKAAESRLWRLRWINNPTFSKTRMRAKSYKLPCSLWTLESSLVLTIHTHYHRFHPAKGGNFTIL